MKVAFRKSFLKDLSAVADAGLRQRVAAVIEEVEAARGMGQVRNAKALSGHPRFFRLRIGAYRLGLVLEGDAAVFVRFLHRREVYRYFP